MRALIRTLAIFALWGAAMHSSAEPMTTSDKGPITAVAAPLGRWQWGFGAGLEVRVQQEINPNYWEAQSLPQFFAQARYFPYTLSLEGSYEQHETNTGPLSITSQSSQLGVWGRYEFTPEWTVSPFVGAGVGLSFDRVDLNYGDGAAAKTYRGRREFFGLSAGLRHQFWRFVVQELETKAVLIEDRRDISWSMIYRLGFVY